MYLKKKYKTRPINKKIYGQYHSLIIFFFERKVHEQYQGISLKSNIFSPIWEINYDHNYHKSTTNKK